MERKKIVAGNWKMNTLYEEGMTLAGEVLEAVVSGIETRSGTPVTVILAPPFHLLKDVSDLVSETPGIAVAAQNAAAESAGAFTGEVSAGMVRSVGASHVILGHSERRTLFGEDDALLKKKVNQALEAGLDVIFCVGEVLRERLGGDHFEVVKRQLDNGLFHLRPDEMQGVVIAYEPVWAIGTGHNATPDQAGEMHRHIRSCVESRFGSAIANELPILYGGSCKPDNAAELFSMPGVDGGLIGGASLKAADFVAIIRSI